MWKSAFTLVELLVVVTLLAIFSSIASIYFFQNFEISRDATRSANLVNITKTLDLYRNDNSKYPEPDDAVNITYSWATAWKQWVFGEDATRLLKSFGSELFQDPKYETFFTYSTANKNREYQIASIYEELDESGSIAFIPEAHAVIETAQVFWDFNNFMVRTQSWSTYNYIATPSIIASDITSTDIIDIISWQKLVYNEFFNLPASYSAFLNTNWGFDFNVSDPLIFSWADEDIKNPTILNDFVTRLHYIYSRTPTESFDRYINFLQNDGTARIKDFLSETYKITFSHAFSCQDLYDGGIATEDGQYEIDLDGSGPLWEDTYYCDIRNDGTAWTKVGWNYIWTNGGDFADGRDISTNYYTLYESSWDNAVVSIANPVGSWYALKQTWDYESNYEVHFDDFSQVSVWREIAMSLWVADEDWVWSNSLWVNPEAGYMFHNRLYYTDGTFSSNGQVEVLNIQTVWGKQWKHIQVLHRVRKEPQSFAWYIGLDAEDTRDLYFTWVKLELFQN